MSSNRPPKHVAHALLAGAGQSVTITNTELVEDCDGTPAGVSVETREATLAVTPAALGWTQDELDNPEVIE
ncbi:hypothetical protein ATK17_0838 [Branchiibius hedensis]|uniref:Uncharacterized protein n=1 Tax=Branchiibius hedensis TaxID=672460 RepID=A0A2Y8ZP06_9MICO|nr:hypothetical protein [Branchiibius hedensis]PWJ24737.1 hypothetical protein ATK17_0838 [Branchiibius hedensis]SSA33554.1 hypothetical protein SAMN04489750_0838 [Branchiibius hedensis]